MRHIFLVSTALAALSLAAKAQAQDTASEDPGNNAIIVTGEKAERSLQDTNTSVAVITPRRIEQENLITLQDVFQRTANVTETYGTAGFTIRGIANYGVSGGGDAALATVYVDGAAMPNNILQAAPTDLWDVAQVEIFRGPQSTLQGLNALAGTVIVRTVDPGDDWEVRARAKYSNADESQFAVALGGPIVPGELAFRVSADKRDADGFTWNRTRNTHENPLDSTNLRAKLLWTPDALPGFEARLSYNHYERYGGYRFSYTDVSVPDFFENRINNSDYPNDSDANTDIATLELGYDLGNGLSLTAISAYSDVEEFNRFDNDTTAEPGAYFDQANDFKTFSQELRLNYEGERLSGLLGGFFYHRDQGQLAHSLVPVPTPVTTISQLLQANMVPAATADYIAGLYAAALPGIPVNYTSTSDSRIQTMALFGDLRFKLTDRLSLLGGFRYDRETNRTALTQDTTFNGVYPDPADFGPVGSDIYFAIMGINAGVAALVADASGSAASVDRTFEAFLPKAGIEMAWTDDLQTAFTVQRGYRSGGSSTNTARSETFAYDPEYTWNYELSLRSAWLDGALTVNANAYYVDWTDQQTAVNFGLNLYDTHTVNAGKSHLYGFELEVAHRVSRMFDWYAALGHTKTKFDEFDTSVGSFRNLAGLEFTYAPRITLSGGMNLRPVDNLSINLNASYRSAVFSQVSNPQSDYRLDGRTLVNVRAAYDFEPFTLAIFASNLFDEDYIQYGAAGEPMAVLGDPRVVGASIDFRW
ncbi:MAG TPA: TonB-dependent receptor [Croceibacterium sp.]|nr:TonB-dependent receptor [Croceibacterium sp.]